MLSIIIISVLIYRLFALFLGCLAFGIIIMQMPNIDQSVKVYAIQVTGISCTNCANNIKVVLTQNVQETSMKINVNVMQEKVYITTSKQQTIQRVIQVLKQTKYKPINEPLLLSGSKQNHRNISFIIDTTKEEVTQEKLKNIVGVASAKFTNQDGKTKVSIEYNCLMVKGRQLGDTIQTIDKGYQIVNQKIQGLSQRKKIEKSQHSLEITISVWLYFLIVHMILPVLPFTKQFYNKCSTFPSSFGIYSFSVLINIAITLYIMKYYAKGYIERSYSNYKNLNTTNMQTLIALGSISAFTLSVFFIIRYTLLGTKHLHMAIMDINDALTSASVIVLTVTIGKHFERKAKLQIEKITDQIFPQSVLFENMKVQYAEMKNRQLKIVNQKQYDVSLIEKGDVLKLVPGRVLVDLIIIQGSLKAVQSARTGNDNQVSLSKGDRLESGSIIYEAQQCLGQVQNVIQNSLLLKLATHVKFAQNVEENNESGIQAICHKITNVFVRGVIVLSVATAVVWTLLLAFNIIEMKGCKICWIFERGISVLVASCPCALGLAVPSVIAIILKLAIKSGILIRSNRVFESMNKVKKIAFDKTGTLFNRLEKIEKHQILCRRYKQEQMWEMIALIQKQIRHPLAEVLYREALTLSKVNGSNFNYVLIGKPVHQDSGISAKILQKKTLKQIDILIGNRKMFSKRSIYVQQSGQNTLSSTQIYLVADKQPCMLLQLDTHSDLRPEAEDVLNKIKQENIEIHILSGDSQLSVQKLGEELKLNNQNLHWEYSSDDKKKWIKEKQQNEESVIMVGDGLNDIPCLQEAHIGISINAKSELNINAADVIILSENLQKILALIRFLRKANIFIRLNLLWAFAYNIITMPIVAGVFYYWGIYLSPIWSCVAMSFSSFFVVAFSHLLVCFHYDDSLIQNKGIERIKSNETSHLADSTREVFANSLSLQDSIIQK